MRSRPQRAGLAVLLLIPVSLASTAAAAPADGGTASALFTVGLPDRPWRLVVDLPGFRMDPIQRLDGGARVRGADDRAGLAVSLTLAISPGDTSARSCRDHDWAGRQRNPLDRADTHLSEQADRARVEFIVSRIEGDPVRQRNILLYLQRDGVCVVVHLTKALYQPSDAAGLERLLGSARLAN